jgi:hypothetical protein
MRGPLDWSGEIASMPENGLITYVYGLQDGTSSAFWKVEEEIWRKSVYGTSGYYGVADAVTSWKAKRSIIKAKLSLPTVCIRSLHSGHMEKHSAGLLCEVECNNGTMIVVCNYDPPVTFWTET